MSVRTMRVNQSYSGQPISRRPPGLNIEIQGKLDVERTSKGAIKEGERIAAPKLPPLVMPLLTILFFISVLLASSVKQDL